MATSDHEDTLLVGAAPGSGHVDSLLEGPIPGTLQPDNSEKETKLKRVLKFNPLPYLGEPRKLVPDQTAPDQHTVGGVEGGGLAHALGSLLLSLTTHTARTEKETKLKRVLKI